MKTNIETRIENLQAAKDYLTQLHVNFEAYHPDSPATDVEFRTKVSKRDCVKLDARMGECFEMFNNADEDIYGFCLELEYPTPTVNLYNPETFISRVETENTGGHIYNDVIGLKNGFIIRISDGVIGIYKNEEKDRDGEGEAYVYF